MLLTAAAKLTPDSAELEVADINEIPLYNQDAETAGLPEPVNRLKQQIKTADAILIATPEYNHSYPGVLKNVIDWASRPYGNNSFNDKPTAIVSASPGQFGGIAAQDQLKHVLLALNTHLITQPAVIVAIAHQKFDENGNLTDPTAIQFLKQLLENLTAFTRNLQTKETLVIPLIASTQ
jgi:chromate reductase